MEYHQRRRVSCESASHLQLAGHAEDERKLCVRRKRNKTRTYIIYLGFCSFLFAMSHLLIRTRIRMHRSTYHRLKRDREQNGR